MPRPKDTSIWAESRLESSGNCWLCPTLPNTELLRSCLAEIEDCLPLCSVLCNGSCSVRFLRRRSWIQHIADTRCGVRCFECAAVGLNAV
jgi:hypothetical protein